MIIRGIIYLDYSIIRIQSEIETVEKPFIIISNADPQYCGYNPHNEQSLILPNPGSRYSACLKRRQESDGQVSLRLLPALSFWRTSGMTVKHWLFSCLKLRIFKKIRLEGI